MMRGVMASEWLKIRRKGIWLLIALGPLGVVGLQALNFFLRYDYLTKRYADDLWGAVIGNVHQLSVPTLLMGIAIVASMIAGIEHQTNAWKQTLALPVSKWCVFACKFTLLCTLLVCACTLLAAGTVVLGIALGYGTDIPLVTLLVKSYLPFLAAMPFAALQTWLSITIKNQAIPLTTGVLFSVLCLFGTAVGDWVPLKWLYLENQWNEPFYSAGPGLLLGLVIYVIGLIHFIRKDVS
ncbi:MULTISPECIES: ABC transporter permease [Brevibacillus]|jgi:hypothetical protein|uniref:Permease n=2 Tax=Brevibacillus borstelensis TaxID=45462 RepID=M8DDS8_9BACL|nr:ABC transporter permease [Brevibacillus borstelensis]EMT51542.1 permease [Brevibacillus borstelensis AK1]KKX56538.1 permease [Brevibacillus borstelensis cifa_chp40]MBE5395349.1 ABC transporter permease [Brevibacillus borstelensis]MCC0562802.1 ABC transporter permease [Brevibacillus borstelensis]MED1745631.1 ABC transporter permease [Brevibacillus borstelensis]